MRSVAATGDLLFKEITTEAALASFRPENIAPGTSYRGPNRRENRRRARQVSVVEPYASH